MGGDFLSGYVKLVEGEKDPRNLIYLFAIDRVVLIEFELSPTMIEKFFDITYCYFPITFKPPPNDPYGITQLDLKTSLRNSLIAHPGFAPHAMPLLLEKLTASSGSAKRDTLETLELALPIFGIAATKANEKKLWEGLKIEIFHATDDATSICAQRTLTSFLRVLYQDLDPPEGIAPKVVAECLNELKFPDKVLASPACSTLVCCIRACPSTSYLAITALVEQQLDLFKDPDEISMRASNLNHLGTMFRTMRETYDGKVGLEKIKVALEYDDEKSGNLKFNAPSSNLTDPSSSSANNDSSSSNKKTSTRSYVEDRKPLSNFLPRLISSISNGLNSPSYRSSALFCFLHSSNIENLFTYEELKYLILDINGLLLLSDREDETSRRLALETLKEISKTDSTNSNGKIIEEIVLPNLFEQLPDRMEEVYLNEDSMQVDGEEQEKNEKEDETILERKLKIKLALGSLSKLCNSNPSLLDLLIVKVSTKLDLCLASSSSSISKSLSSEKLKKAREDNVGYARGLILTLHTIFEERSKLTPSSITSKVKEVESRPKIGFGINKATSKEESKDVLLLRYSKDLPIRLCSLILASSINLSLSLYKSPQEAALDPIGTDSKFLTDSSSLLSLLFRSLNKNQQDNVRTWLFPIFTSGHFDSNLRSFRSLNEALTRSKDDLSKDWKFSPLGPGADRAQKDSTILLASFLTSCDSSIAVPSLQPTSEFDITKTDVLTINWFAHLLSLAKSSSSDFQLETYLSLLETCSNKQIGSLKSSDGGAFSSKLPVEVDNLLEQFWDSEIGNKTLDINNREKAIQAWLSISRGFVVRAHSKGEEMIEKVINSLFEEVSEDEKEMEIKVLAAKALGMVAREGGNLRKENGAVVRVSTKSDRRESR